jgi:hypothetical protein
VARQSTRQRHPTAIHRYLRHRRVIVSRHGHLPIAARVKRDMAEAKVPGPAIPMTLGNMRELGVQRLIASCLHDFISPRLARRSDSGAAR